MRERERKNGQRKENKTKQNKRRTNSLCLVIKIAIEKTALNPKKKVDEEKKKKEGKTMIYDALLTN